MSALFIKSFAFPFSRTVSTRLYSTPSSFKSHPSPPRLPKEDQEEFEKLQKEASENRFDAASESVIHAELRKTYADFEGEVNPQTGEVGGPKQDPLRHGDYSFNGRVTDF